MKRAIIIGATGAIGTALVQELTDHEIEVLVLCHKGSERNRRIPESDLVKRLFCSLEELSTLENNSDLEYDVFYDLAWEGTTGQARNDMFLQNRNVQYTLEAVRAAHRFGCHTFIGAGSQAEYGRVEGILRSDTPVSPDNGYGIGKLCAGLMTRELTHQLGMQHIWTRILSVYGPNDGMRSMVMSVISDLLHRETPKCTKGEQKWDYLYSGDAGRAFRLLGEKGVDGKTYVIGSGECRPLADYIREIRDAVNPGAEIDFGTIPYANRQVMHLQADISELQKDTGFVPKTSFEEGILKTVQWIKNESGEV